MTYTLKHDVTKLDDGCYPDVTLAEGITHEQKTALFRKWKQNDQNMRWVDFARAAQLTFGCDGAIAVKWCGMWLCIERDGYCHS